LNDHSLKHKFDNWWGDLSAVWKDTQASAFRNSVVNSLGDSIDWLETAIDQLDSYLDKMKSDMLRIEETCASGLKKADEKYKKKHLGKKHSDGPRWID
jgi:hypothetical protein